MANQKGRKKRTKNYFRYSYDPSMKSCMLLSECNTLDTSNYGMGCRKCISGEKECDESETGSKCWIPGRCHGVMIGLEKTCSQKDCLGACLHNSQCNYFTYDAKTQFCELISITFCILGGSYKRVFSLVSPLKYT